LHRPFGGHHEPGKFRILSPELEPGKFRILSPEFSVPRILYCPQNSLPQNYLDDFTAYNGEQGAKEAGKMRLEGKTYTMQEGDICHFRFNV